jgi:uncharacterized protein YijF (DUF1287 family)
MDPLIAGIFTSVYCDASFARYTYPDTLFAVERTLASDILSRAICHAQDVYVREKHHPSLVAEFVQ